MPRANSQESPTLPHFNSLILSFLLKMTLFLWLMGTEWTYVPKVARLSRAFLLLIALCYLGCALTGAGWCRPVKRFDRRFQRRLLCQFIRYLRTSKG